MGIRGATAAVLIAFIIAFLKMPRNNYKSKGQVSEVLQPIRETFE